jgi:hypothetical protein
MAVAVRAHAERPRTSQRMVVLCWALRGAGLIGGAAAILVTPEFVSRAMHGGTPLHKEGIESLLLYRGLALAGGLAALVLAAFLPRLHEHRERLLEPIGVALPLAVVAVFTTIKAWLGPEHTAYTGLVGEDHVVEYATSVLYLGAGWLAVGVARGLWRRDERLLGWLWAGFAAALAIVSLEEISWGQRLFGVPTPAVLESNVQNEMTLHNMPLMHHFLPLAYAVVGLYGSFGRAVLGERGSPRFRTLVRWLVPRSSLAACFLPVVIVYGVLELTAARPDGMHLGFVSTFDQEPAELLLALGFLLFAVHGRARLQGWLREGDRER